MKNRCATCHTALLDDSIICEKRECRIRHHLNEIPKLHLLASESLRPGNGGSGSTSGQRTIGLNVQALDYSAAYELIDALHYWERFIRRDQKLTPPALVAHTGSIAGEVEATCKFHYTHLDWTLAQPWANDFTHDVASLFNMGMAATGQSTPKGTRVTCPTTFIIKPTEPGGEETTEPCGETLMMSRGMSILDTVRCRHCGTEWTTEWLMKVALSIEQVEVWADAEAIGHRLGISAHQIRKIARKEKIQPWHGLYNLIAFPIFRRHETDQGKEA